MESSNITHLGLPCIRSRLGEVFNFENKTIYDVYAAITDINKNPDSYKFLPIALESLIPQLLGHNNHNMDYVNSMSLEDAVRPVLVGTELGGEHRLLDGYHRAYRLWLEKQPGIFAWILNTDQTKAITYPFHLGMTEPIDLPKN